MTTIDCSVRDHDGVRHRLVQVVAQVLARHDAALGAHVRRVGHLAGLLAARLDLEPCERRAVEDAGVVHDVGKLGVPRLLLDKRGPLSAIERGEIERHAAIGARTLGALSDAFSPLAAGVRAHHERWDGNGYPDRLRGEEIPRIARVLSVIDVYDALTHARAYRDPMTASQAREYLEEHAGTQFDPQCVDAAVEVLWEQDRGLRRFALS